MSEAGAWMPMYWADYFADTLHLSAEEHGAYLLLIGSYWRRGSALPDDDVYLRKLAKISSHKWKNVRKTLSTFFKIDNGFWWHGRVETEILRSTGRQQSAIANGRAGGLAKSYLTTTTTTSTKKEERNSNVQPPAALPRKRSAVSVLNGHADHFQKWYDIYPVHKGRGHAERAFVTALKTISFDDLMERTRRYAASIDGTEKRYIPHPATWLNAKRYLDDDGPNLLSERRRPQAPPNADDNRPLEDV